MLATVTLTKVEGIGKDQMVLSASGTAYLLNGNRIQGLSVRGSVNSKFMYVFHKGDPREKATYMEASEAVSVIRADADKTWNSAFVALPFYTDNDTSKAQFTRYINVEDIVFARADSASATRSWVVYMEGGKRMELLSSYTLAQIKALCDNGTLTTSA